MKPFDMKYFLITHTLPKFSHCHHLPLKAPYLDDATKLLRKISISNFRFIHLAVCAKKIQLKTFHFIFMLYISSIYFAIITARK